MLIKKVGNQDHNLYTEDYDLILEASAERERVKKFMDDNLGKDYFDKYLKIRNRLTDKNLKDFNTIVNLDPEDVKVAIDRYSPKDTNDGKKKVGENGKWTVYHVTTFPAAQELGEGTEWCITGRYGSMDPNDDHYFNDYIRKQNLDGGYYFYIPKSGNKKYCLLLTKNGKVDSLWGTPNGRVYDVSGLGFPEVRGIDLSTLEDLWGKLDAAYYNDDPEEWFSISYELADRGDGEPDFPYIWDMVYDNKPNFFKYMMDEGFGDISNDELLDGIAQIYNSLSQFERDEFLSALGDKISDIDDYEDFCTIMNNITEEEDKSSFLLDYLPYFDFISLTNCIDLKTLLEWSEESWFDQNNVMDSLLSNFKDDLKDVLDSIGFDDDSTSIEDRKRILRLLDHLSYAITEDETIEDVENLNMKNMIIQYIDNKDDRSVKYKIQDYIDLLYNMGIVLKKDDIKEIEKELKKQDMEIKDLPNNIKEIIDDAE